MRHRSPARLRRCLWLVWIFLLPAGAFAQVSSRQLGQALKDCEQDLQQATHYIDSLRNALQATEQLWSARKAATDSLIHNLESQLSLQAKIARRFQANADTLDLMVQDYAAKLDELNRLYIRELKRRGKPWFLSGKGLTGFMYGLFIGGALGVTYVAVID
ncbi:MAG: hypothetical protein D6715_05175 [Calditrichaeota bacterium]|nr:MAG: hypothetical protein D6715_05175 [Calditrichota bacterium]